MILRLDREESEEVPGRVDKVTFGDFYVDGAYECCALEDEVRERPGRHCLDWKIAGRTAVPSGTYLLGKRLSPKFGEDTLVILDVPCFTLVEIHGGCTIDDTEGCPLVGTVQDRLTGRLHGAKFTQKVGDVELAPALPALKAKVVPVLNRLEKVFLQIRNAPAWYLAHGLAVPKAIA